MKTITAPSRIVAGKRYFIRKSDAWYREGAHGYTTDLSHAGIFNAKDAAGHIDHCPGVSAVPVDSMKAELWKEVQSLLARAAKISELVVHN